MSLDIAALPHSEALVAAIRAAGGTAYSPGDLKKLPELPAFYTEVWVAPRVDENSRVGALGGITGARVVTRAVAQNHKSAEAERALAAKALLGAVVTVNGETYGPIRREVGDDPIGDEGDGWWSGTSTWIYA